MTFNDAPFTAKAMKASFLLAAAAVTSLLAGSAGAADAKIDFAKDIQPLLEKSCVSCHGAEKQKGDLRLDSRAATLKGGKDGASVVPGQADKSDLYRRVTLAPGSDDIMPSKGDLLTKAQTDLIRDWINQGANWPDSIVLKAVGGDAGKPAADTVFAALGEPKSAAGEAAALAKLEAAGVAVRPIAMNLKWREANFRMLGTNVTDETIAPVRDVLPLVELNLAGTRVTDAGLQPVEALTSLLALHLEHTKITDAGLAHLKNLSHLGYLNLFDTAVTDAGLENLKGLKSLKRLYVWETKVTEAGAAELKKAIPGLQISLGWEHEPVVKSEPVAAKETAKAQKSEDKKAEKPADKPADKPAAAAAPAAPAAAPAADAKKDEKK